MRRHDWPIDKLTAPPGEARGSSNSYKAYGCIKCARKARRKIGIPPRLASPEGEGRSNKSSWKDADAQTIGGASNRACEKRNALKLCTDKRLH